MMRLDYQPALPLPLLPQDVDASWLTRAMRQTLSGVTIETAEIVEILWGTSTKIRVRISGSRPDGAPLPGTVIVKGGFEKHSPTMAAMYANEARFYADIQPRVPMASPHCYFAGSDPGSHQSIVIMEDLRRDGVIFCDPLKPQAFEEIARRVEAMAAYHAATWESPAFDPGGRWADAP